MQNILTGVALAALVVYFFLRRLGATATISLSMPFCVVAVMLMLNVCDITLNMISLGGIAICVGMVVDNSIVVLENIYRYAGEGYGRYESCVLGTKEVVLPITASSLTTVAVFLPVGLAGGLAGMIFRDFALTVVFLIVFSLVIALTLVPLMCYFLLEENKVRLDLQHQVEGLRLHALREVHEAAELLPGQPQEDPPGGWRTGPLLPGLLSGHQRGPDARHGPGHGEHRCLHAHRHGAGDHQ